MVVRDAAVVGVPFPVRQSVWADSVGIPLQGIVEWPVDAVLAKVG
jgi:hypothetical protein